MNDVARGIQIGGVGNVVDNAAGFVYGPEFDIGFPLFEVDGVWVCPFNIVQSPGPLTLALSPIGREGTARGYARPTGITRSGVIAHVGELDGGGGAEADAAHHISPLEAEELGVYRNEFAECEVEFGFSGAGRPGRFVEALGDGDRPYGMRSQEGLQAVQPVFAIIFGAKHGF